MSKKQRLATASDTKKDPHYTGLSSATSYRSYEEDN
jgi:hypothetical protein